MIIVFGLTSPTLEISKDELHNWDVMQERFTPTMCRAERNYNDRMATPSRWHRLLDRDAFEALTRHKSTMVGSAHPHFLRLSSSSRLALCLLSLVWPLWPYSHSLPRLLTLSNILGTLFRAGLTRMFQVLLCASSRLQTLQIPVHHGRR